MAGVHRTAASLEGEDGVGRHGPEARAQLVGREAELVEAVAPPDALQHLQLAARQPVAGFLDYLQVVWEEVGLTTLNSFSPNPREVGLYF